MREVARSVQVDGGGRPVLELIRDVRAGTVSGRALDGESRRACVSYLVSEGYGVAEIAALLGVSDRTVARDRARMREELAVERDPMLLPRMVGHLMAEAEGAAVRLRRIARDKGTPAAARVEAERATWGIHVDLVRLLQGLGYLPQAPRPVSARVRLGQEEEGDAPEVEELMAELTRIEEIAGGGAGSGLAEGASGVSDGGDGVSGGDVGGTSGAAGGGGGGGSQLGMLRSDLGRLVIAARIAAIGTLVDQQESTTRKDSSNGDSDEADEQEQHQRIEAEAGHQEEHEHGQPRERRATRSARGTRAQAGQGTRAKSPRAPRPPRRRSAPG